jgi:hypothetical protein
MPNSSARKHANLIDEDKLYLDTLVLGAICDPGPPERLEATRREAFL